MLNGKFVCTRDDQSGVWFTKGKIYEFKDGIIMFDDGWSERYHTIENFEIDGDN